MDETTYKEIFDKIAEEIKNASDANIAARWAECLKDVTVANAVNADKKLKEISALSKRS